MIYNNEPSQRNSTSATHYSIQRQSSSFFIHFLIQAGSCNIFPVNLFPLPLCSIPFIPFHLSATHSHSQHVSQETLFQVLRLYIRHQKDRRAESQTPTYPNNLKLQLHASLGPRGLHGAIHSSLHRRQLLSSYNNTYSHKYAGSACTMLRN